MGAGDSSLDLCPCPEPKGSKCPMEKKGAARQILVSYSDMFALYC